MRTNLKPQSAFYPMPVVIIGTYDENKIPNAMNAAWGGISDTNELQLCVSHTHKTADNIIKNKCFTASCGTKDTVIACDYVGMVTGKKVIDKVEKAGLHALKAEKVNAPLFKELPFALECKVKSYDPKNGKLIAKIVNISVDNKVMNKGKVSVKKLQPLVFDALNLQYLSVGEKVGNAFKDFKKIK